MSSRSRNARERRRLREVADGVEAGVRPELAQQARVVVAQRAEVKLHRPAFLGVEPAEEEHHERGELRVVGRATRLCRSARRRRSRSLRTRVQASGVAALQAVIGKPAAVLVEKVAALAQGLEKVGQRRRCPTPLACSKPAEPGVESLRPMHGERRVGTERRQHARREAARGDRLVMAQVVRGIVRRAKRA